MHNSQRPRHRLLQRSLYLLVFLGSLSILRPLLAAEFPLVQDGKPAAAIVTGSNPGKLVQLAVVELHNYFDQLSGAHLPVSTGEPLIPQAQTLLLLGHAQDRAFTSLLRRLDIEPPTSLRSEGYVLRTTRSRQGPAVLLCGADDAGALYGTYELLERLGVTFRLTGDILPARTNRLALLDLDISPAPAMSRRGFLFPANFDNASAFSWPDYQRLIDQMARMKCNYLQFWWFAYAPWIQYSYRGETKWMGDVSAKESGYHSWVYEGFGSRTIEDVTIGREHFRDRPRMAPMELQQAQTPQEAFDVCRDLLRRIIDYAHSRNIQVWLAIEMASLPPNLARHGEVVGDDPFNYIFGTFLHPLDPVNREIQTIRLKAIAETYPQADGLFLNFAELYPKLVTDEHRAFFKRERSKFRKLQELSAPWASALANVYEVEMDDLIDSNAGYFDLFKFILRQRDEVVPNLKLGLMTVGRGYTLPLFHKMLPETIPFASLESSGVWTIQGVPMRYFDDMGSRERIIQPRVDDDFDMMGMQFSVRQFAEKDRLFVDGIKYGLTGFAGQVERARGTEFNSSFLAQAAWRPDLTTESFYQESATRIFGTDAAPDMIRALLKLEECQADLGYYGHNVGYGVLLCCSAVREVNVIYRYSQQKNPYRGPVLGAWKRFMGETSDFIERREGSIRLLNEALAYLHDAGPRVSPQAQAEWRYLVNRTESFRDALAALNTLRRGMLQFDEAFKKRDDLDHAQFVSQLEAGLHTFQEGSEQIKTATRKYSEIIDHVSDLAVLYHLNARAVLGIDLSAQTLENVVNYHRGKPYLRHVPFERLFPRRPDKGLEE